MGRRHLARELALKVLFELESDGGGDLERALEYQAAESNADPETVDFARTLIHGVQEHQQEIDARLAEASSNWDLDQMAKVERTLLRIATFELSYLPSVPLKAAINESIELAKTFGGPDSGKFVNGILGRIAADLQTRPPAADEAAAKEA
ncbi:MAG TPA: transcription antitermination factor NusB [Candidatus Angelobacter sp.]|jgi:N utilization substance protein B|nr:transcription antitermination factor NusB [Candidatus Angelobacter sp.]